MTIDMGAPASSGSAARRSLSSVTNALLVVEYLVDAGEAGVSEIARRIGVSNGTAHRLAATLVSTGFAEQNSANRKYRVSRKLVALGQRARRTLSAREIAHAQLNELVATVHETVNLAILSDGMVLYVDKVTCDQPFGIEARVGSRLPAYCTALGKVLVAGLDEASLIDYLAQLGKAARRRDDPPPPRPARFRSEIEAVRREGHALDLGEYLPDVYCTAAPVVNGEGETIAAISVAVPRSRFESKREILIAEVEASASALSRLLQELGLPESPGELAVDPVR